MLDAFQAMSEPVECVLASTFHSVSSLTSHVDRSRAALVARSHVMRWDERWVRDRLVAMDDVDSVLALQLALWSCRTWRSTFQHSNCLTACSGSVPVESRSLLPRASRANVQGPSIHVAYRQFHPWVADTPHGSDLRDCSSAGDSPRLAWWRFPSKNATWYMRMCWYWITQASLHSQLTALISAWIWRSSSTWDIFSCMSSSSSRRYSLKHFSSASAFSTWLTILSFNFSSWMVFSLQGKSNGGAKNQSRWEKNCFDSKNLVNSTHLISFMTSSFANMVRSSTDVIFSPSQRLVVDFCAIFTFTIELVWPMDAEKYL